MCPQPSEENTAAQPSGWYSETAVPLKTPAPLLVDEEGYLRIPVELTGRLERIEISITDLSYRLDLLIDHLRTKA